MANVGIYLICDHEVNMIHVLTLLSYLYSFAEYIQKITQLYALFIFYVFCQDEKSETLD